MVLRLHKLGEVEKKCILHNSVVLAIFLPKIVVKVGEKFNKIMRETVLTVFLNTVYGLTYCN